MNEQDRATAYHEAGHAIAAYRLGHEAGHITIVPTEGTLGSSLSEAESFTGETDVEQIIVLYAGYASESKYHAGADKLGSHSDDEKAAHLLQFTNETEASLRAKAAELIKTNWTAIEAVAEELILSKTLTEGEWTIIIDAFDEGEDWKEVLREYRRRWGDKLEPGKTGEGGLKWES